MSSHTPVEQLLLDLLAIPSVSGNEAAVVDALEHRLKTNFEITRIPAGDGRDSLLCLRGTPRVLFCAHIDTILGVVEVRSDESSIYSRGACDNKGAAAAMIIAEQVETVLAELGIQHSITVELDIKAVDHTPEGQPKQIVSYFTEMAFLPNSFVVGPGSIKNAHTDNEFVPRSELNAAVELYKGYLNSRS